MGRPNNPYYAKNVPVPKRDVAKAKALLKEAGVHDADRVDFMMPHDAESAGDRAGRAGDGEGGGLRREDPVDRVRDLAQHADKGQFEAYVLAWSGRADPDGNLYSFDACKQPLNYAGYCKPEVDELLNDARAQSDPAERKAIYEQIAAIAAEGPADRLPLPPQVAVGVHAKLEASAGARRAGAGGGTEAEVSACIRTAVAMRSSSSRCAERGPHRVSAAEASLRRHG